MVSEVSNKEEHETSTRSTIEEVIMTHEFSRKEELETNFASTTTKLRKSHILTPYIPPHRRFRELDAIKDKNLHSNYKMQKALPRHKHTHILEMNHRLKNKMQKVIPSHKHTHMPEICCNFIQGTKKNHMNGPVYTTTKSLKWIENFQNKDKSEAIPRIQSKTKDIIRKRIAMTKKRKIKRTCMKIKMWKTKMKLQKRLL